MWKKRIGQHIPSIARRLFSSRLSLQSFETFQCSKTMSNLCGVKIEEESRVFKTTDFPACRSFVYSRKNFCSASSKKMCCWNCDAAAETSPFLVCESCRTVQPVDHSANYFQIFGWEKSYEIPNDNLEGKYKDWQKKLHPDLVHSKSEREKTYAAEQSSRVIDAYRTLSSPLSRAIYLMRLEGVEVDEEQTVSEPELLAEIMEIREAVEEASDAPTLNNIQAQIKEKLKDWSKSFGNAFQRRQYEEAHVCIQRMTYYQRVIEEIVKKL